MQSYRILRTQIKNWKGYSRIIEGLALYFWPKVIGETFDAHTNPQRVSGGTLWVRTEDASIAHQLTFLVPQIIKKYEQLIGKGIVNKVRFEIGQLEQENKEPSAEEVFPDHPIDAGVLEAAACINDDELRAKFLKVAQKATNKKVFYLKKGWRTCACGSLTWTEGLCFECRRKEEEEKFLLVNYILANRPGMQYEEIKQQIPFIEEKQWNKIKILMKQRTEDFISLRSRELRRGKKINEEGIKDLVQPAQRFLLLGGDKKTLAERVGLDIWPLLQRYLADCLC